MMDIVMNMETLVNIISRGLLILICIFSICWIVRRFINFIREYIEDREDYNIYRIKAEAENTPVNVLEILAKNPKKYVREAVAKNRNTPAAVLETLAKDKNPNVRGAVALSPHTPIYALETLAKDADQDVRLAVAQNPNTPVAVLEKLTRDEKFWLIAGNRYRKRKRI